MPMTINQLHKYLGKLIDAGNGRRRVCVDKETFYHPLEADGATVLEVNEAGMSYINNLDDDGGVKINKDGTESMTLVCVLGGGYERLREGGSDVPPCIKCPVSGWPCYLQTCVGPGRCERG